MIVFASLILFLENVRAGRILHAGFLRNIISSPMSFFDTTPSGRVLNRCGKDVDTIDQVLAPNIHAWAQCVLRVLTVPIVIEYSTPLFLAVVVLLGILYFVVQVSQDIKAEYSIFFLLKKRQKQTKHQNLPFYSYCLF